MNIANKLTMLRVFMIPVFVVLMKLNIPMNFLWALIIF
ncbi:MAG TPA: CDP-alcohol phosphatidyltransferase family protein, partial [Oscillospiraceae bacterium]|nr:CDP-alcohol phosphatidyltransferase family protein [Oscillospiraceae bacterium]